MSVPKTEDITEDQEITKVKSETIYIQKHSQANEAENPFQKDYKLCARDEENFGVTAASTAEVELDSYNTANINEATFLPDSGPAARCSPLWNQVVTVTPSILLAFMSGLTMGYPTILITQHKSETTQFLVGNYTISWIAAISCLLIVPGCLISGLMMEKLGRRISQVIICVPLLLGWTLIATGINVPLLMIGRFFTSSCASLGSPLSSIYIAETSEPRFRGCFISGLTLAEALGMLAIHSLGTSLTWQWTACVCCLFLIQVLGILFIIPESPTWLIARGRVEEGVKAYGWLRGYSDKAKSELRAILEKQKEVDLEPAMSWLDKQKMLIRQKLLKPLFIMTFFFIVSDLSALNVVRFYFMHIIIEFSPSVYYHYYALMILIVCIVIISAIACAVSQLCGRRLVAVLSGLFTALSLIGLSVLFSLRKGMYIEMPWLLLLCMMVFTCANYIGLVPLPWVMCGEIFPARVRSLGSSLSTATSFTVLFIVNSTFHLITEHVGYFIFSIFGVVTLAGTVVLYFILPETIGKSLQDIEEEFQGN